MLLCDLELYAWLFLNVGNVNVFFIFLSLVKQRLNDNVVQNWLSRLYNSSRALFDESFPVCNVKYIPYLVLCKTVIFRFRVLCI